MKWWRNAYHLLASHLFLTLCKHTYCVKNKCHKQTLFSSSVIHLLNMDRNRSTRRALHSHINLCSSQNKHFFSDSDELHSSSSSLVLQDGESDTDSLEADGRRIFYSGKRVKNSPEINDQELSSVSDTRAEEDVAHCLMMLSRDRWERQENDNHGWGVKVIMKKDNKVRGKYKCETCNKLFKSYQALGGHRASYKKIKADAETRRHRHGELAAAAEDKVHKCPFCGRVFASGQALGGHKRSHFMGASKLIMNSKNVDNFDIDLNQPALPDDDS